MNAINKADYLWKNGQFIPWDHANVHLMTHSLHYASSVFEGIRVYNGKIFKLEQHIKRFFASAEQLMLKIDYTPLEIINMCKELVSINKLSNAYIRPLAWMGAESSKLLSPLLSTNVMISGWEIDTPKSQPLNLCIAKWINIPPQSIPIQCKTGGRYTTMIINKAESIKQGFDDAILLDWRGYISECTTSNIFFVLDNTIVTPIADACLNGITRQTIFDIAKKLDIIVVEQHITPKLLLKYQECFITGTAVEVKEVRSINFTALKDQNIATEKLYNNNLITKIVQKNYRNLVNEQSSF